MPSSAILEALPASATSSGVLAEPVLAAEPGWLAERRAAAWREFTTRPLPTRKDERWRYASLGGLDLSPYHIPTAAPTNSLADDLRARAQLVPAIAQLDFADGHLLGQSPLPEPLARRGVLFLPLAEALERHPGVLREHLFRSDRALGGEKFLGLHQAHARAGAVLYVPDGVEILETFVVTHWTASTHSAIFPHTLIIAGANTNVRLLDYYGSASNDEPGLVVGAATVIAGPGAHVFRKSIQNLNLASLSFQMDTTVGGRDADVKNISVHLGAHRARFENQVRLAGPGAHLKVYALTIARGQQEFDQRTYQEHAAPRATSNLLFKNALLDESRTIFAGMIRVDPAAEETDAYQQNRNLLLDPAAEADSLPGLEIMNCNVRCTHGATTSRLDPEELFYLNARGLSRETAHQLLIFGFFEEIIEKVEQASLADLLRRLVHEKLAQNSAKALRD